MTQESNISRVYFIYAVSDATGEMAMNIAFAAMRQFNVEQVHIVRRGKVTDLEKIREVIEEAKEHHGIIVHTMVSPELRKAFHEETLKEGILTIDTMGPVLNAFSTYFDEIPSIEPGLKYRVTKEYFRRQEAIEFTVKHDDGLGLETLNQADIILFGISRTSKTPLSVYLAYRGYKVANIPIVEGIALPESTFELDRTKMVLLTIDPQKLVQLRESRLQKLGRPLSEDYANLRKISSELQFAEEILRRVGKIPVIDVTDKAIEETASEVLVALGK